MVRLVENEVIKEKCYTNRPKIIYLFMRNSAEISPCEIRSLLDYDRGQCAKPSYLKTTKLKAFTDGIRAISSVSSLKFGSLLFPWEVRLDFSSPTGVKIKSNFSHQTNKIKLQSLRA